MNGSDKRSSTAWNIGKIRQLKVEWARCKQAGAQAKRIAQAREAELTLERTQGKNEAERKAHLILRCQADPEYMQALDSVSSLELQAQVARADWEMLEMELTYDARVLEGVGEGDRGQDRGEEDPD